MPTSAYIPRPKILQGVSQLGLSSVLDIYGFSRAHTPQTSVRLQTTMAQVGKQECHSSPAQLHSFLFPCLSFQLLTAACTFCFHSFCSCGAASWACRCCWSHWSAVQQLANPPKLLSCNARVHLPFCLLQPPVGFFKIIYIYIYIFGRKSANPKQCCVNSAVTLW